MVPLWLFRAVCGGLMGYAVFAAFRGALRLCRVFDTLGDVPRMRVRLPWPQRVWRWCGPLLVLAAFAIPIALQFVTQDVVRVRERDGEQHADRWKKFGRWSGETLVLNESARPLAIYHVYYAVDLEALVPPGGVGAAPDIEIIGADAPVTGDSIYPSWVIRAN